MALIPEQDFKLLFESAPGLNLVLLPDFTIVAVSDAYLSATMTTREAITGHDLFEIFPDNPDDNAADGVLNLHASLNYVLHQKQPHAMAVQKYDVRRPDGVFEVRYWSPLNTPVLNQLNEVIYIIHNVADVTVCQVAEQQLKRKEKDYHVLIDSVKDYAIFMVDTNGRVASWNNGARNMKGYTAGEIIGKPMDIFYTEEAKERGEPQRNLNMTLQQGHYETEGLRVRKDGTTFFANVVFTSLIDDEGKLYGFAKVTRDISEKRKVDERIRFLASIADNIQDPVISTDINFNITRWNKPAEELFEWKSEEVIGNNATELLKANYVAGSSDLIFEFLTVKHSWQGEVIYYSKTGKPLHALITASHLKNAEAKITGYLILVKDISARKKAEKELAKLNSDLEEKVKERTERVVNTLIEKNIILESIGDAFFAVDKEWTVSYWNRMAEIALSVNKDEILGKNLWEIFPDSIDSESYKKYLGAMATNQVAHFDDYYPALNKWYEISAYPSENGLSVYFKDVTEKKKATEEIAKLNLELEERVLIRTEQLRKSVEEMEAFSYSVSHDLRAPLRGIIGFANILDEDYGSKLDDEAKRITSVIKKNTARMGQLIDDLLNFSRTGRQELIKTNVDTYGMIRGIIDELNLNHRGDKTINWIIHPLPFITADIAAMKQVWINLISNAVKYSGNAAHPEIEIGSTRESESIAFFVKDNGVGFDEKYKAKLFKVFQRLHTSEEFEGTGIGLAIVDKVISRHGGSVWAEAVLNKGATFYFSLPIDKEQLTSEY